MPKDESSNQKSKNSADMQTHKIGDRNDFQVNKNTGKYLAAKRTPPSKRHFTPEQTQYISSLENVIVSIAESMNVSAADLYETYRITPARRDLLDKIQSKAMRDAADAMGPDGEDFRASSIKKSDGALSRISRIELMKMKGKPEDKRTHAQHPMHRFFPDDRSPDQLTDRALNADLAAERKREISNRPKKKKTS
jgi:hypothetical protein